MRKTRRLRAIRRHQNCSFAVIANPGNILTSPETKPRGSMASITSANRSGAQDRQVMTLKFWGVRGSIPTPGPTTLQYGGNTSCIEVRADNQIIILDAGTGLRLLGRELL